MAEGDSGLASVGANIVTTTSEPTISSSTSSLESSAKKVVELIKNHPIPSGIALLAITAIGVGGAVIYLGSSLNSILNRLVSNCHDESIVNRRERIRQTLFENWHKLALPAVCNQPVNRQALIEFLVGKLAIVTGSQPPDDQSLELKQEITRNIIT